MKGRNLSVIGYARVSTEEQHLDLQRDALEQAGCCRIFEDQGISAVAPHRPGFEQALDALQPGDQFVIWKMDRAFRSLRHALDTLEAFESRGIAFRSLTDQIDTGTAMGRFEPELTAGAMHSRIRPINQVTTGALYCRDATKERCCR